jgi:hypothetical protein
MKAKGSLMKYGFAFVVCAAHLASINMSDPSPLGGRTKVSAVCHNLVRIPDMDRY